MTLPRHFGFDDEAQTLKQNARRFLAEQCPVDKLHRLVAHESDPARPSECIWDKPLWQQMVDLGWTAAAVPERAEGLGMPAVAIVGLVEEIGRAALPSPLMATLAATYVLRACGTNGADALLRRIATGTPVSLAHIDARGSWEYAHTDVHAREENGAVFLDGTAYFVQDARKAEVFLVKARAASGMGWYIVEASAPGVSVLPDTIVDLTRDQARVALQNVKVSADGIASKAGEAERALREAEPALLLLLTADMIGAAEWQLQTTAEYARTRVQFDHPIGFFQAVKHPLVNLMMMIDDARSLLYKAAAVFDHEPEQAEIYARMAKSSASDVAAFGSGRSVQLHGGIGFTWECFIHLHFKRQMHNEALLGDGMYQRAKLADKWIGPIGANP